MVNFDLPNEPESYVHRIGRTGRAGASGSPCSFCSVDERPFLAESNGSSANTSRWWRTHPYRSGSTPGRPTNLDPRQAHGASALSLVHPDMVSRRGKHDPPTRIPTAARAARAANRSGLGVRRQQTVPIDRRTPPRGVVEAIPIRFATTEGPLCRIMYSCSSPHPIRAGKEEACHESHLNGNRADNLSLPTGSGKPRPSGGTFRVSALLEQALRRREGHLAATGPLVVQDRRAHGPVPQRPILRPGARKRKVDPLGKTNRPFDADKYESLRARLFAYLEGRDSSSRIATWARTKGTGSRSGSSPRWRGTACSPGTCSSRDGQGDAPAPRPRIHRHQRPGFHSRPEMDGTRSEVFILIHFGRKEVLIGGTMLRGRDQEVDLHRDELPSPAAGVLPMHCAASYRPRRPGRGGPLRPLRHGEDDPLRGPGADAGRATTSTDGVDDGVFNFEGGCYAKVIHLSPGWSPRSTSRPVLRHDARERGDRHRVAAARPGRRDAHGEHPRLLPALLTSPRSSAEGALGHPKNVVMLTATPSA